MLTTSFRMKASFISSSFFQQPRRDLSLRHKGTIPNYITNQFRAQLLNGKWKENNEAHVDLGERILSI